MKQVDLERRPGLAEVAQSMLFFDDTSGNVPPVGYRFVRHESKRDLGEVDKTLVIAHGLPGIEWRKRMEDEAAKLVQTRNEIGVLLLTAGGLRRPKSDLRISQRERKKIEQAALPFLNDPFDFRSYLDAFLQTLGEIQRTARKTTKLDVAGHSWGSTVMQTGLQLYRPDNKLGSRKPGVVSYLAPFVCYAVGESIGDNAPKPYALDIFNDGKTHTVHDQRAKLLSVFGNCENDYNLEGDRHALMRTVVGRSTAGFMGVMHNVLPHWDRSKVQVVTGGRDEFISPKHSELLCNGSLRDQDEVDRVTLAEDTHQLESLRIEDLVQASSFLSS